MMLFAGLFAREFQAAIEVWNASTAYGHCYLILPMTVYLLWERRELIAISVPSAEPRWALLGAPLALAWLVAERLGIMEGRQLVAIAGFELLFLVLLGWQLFWALSGPLLYLVFLVPFGAFITPALQTFTADFTVFGLNLLGIPNFSDRFTIETPAGTFLVAEACAGLRFLIAAVAFGVFYALLCFRSPARRLSYIMLSIAVPIIANGFRALGIVVLGQILGSAQAAAADHILYGWIFFSIVMLLLVAVGQPFRETSAVVQDTARPATSVVRQQKPIWAAVVVIFLVAAGPAVAAAIDLSSKLRPLAEAPAWVAPAGCVTTPEVPTVAGRQRLAMTCRTGTYLIELTTYPARSTARSLIVDRQRHTRELSAEDTAMTPVERQDGWTLVQTTDPDGALVFESWIDGKPAIGGLDGRIVQARDSLFGSNYQPVLATITAADPGRIASQRRQDVVQQLTAIVAAQGDFSALIARISKGGPAT